MKSNKHYLTILMIIVAMLSFWVGWQGMTDLNQARIFSNWVRAEGTVLNSQVEGKRAIHPEIEYKYWVDSVEYEGKTNLNAPGFGTKANRRDQATKLVAKYIPGSNLVVYFDPADPGRSVLRPYPVWSAYTRVGTGFIIFVISGILLAYRLARFRKISRPTSN